MTLNHAKILRNFFVEMKLDAKIVPNAVPDGEQMVVVSDDIVEVRVKEDCTFATIYKVLEIFTHGKK